MKGNGKRGRAEDESNSLLFILHRSSFILFHSGSGGIRTLSISRFEREWSAKLPTEPERSLSCRVRLVNRSHEFSSLARRADAHPA
jgi:hypothetical protein